MFIKTKRRDIGFMVDGGRWRSSSYYNKFNYKQRIIVCSRDYIFHIIFNEIVVCVASLAKDASVV